MITMLTAIAHVVAWQFAHLPHAPLVALIGAIKQNGPLPLSIAHDIYQSAAKPLRDLFSPDQNPDGSHSLEFIRDSDSATYLAHVDGIASGAVNIRMISDDDTREDVQAKDAVAKQRAGMVYDELAKLEEADLKRRHEQATARHAQASKDLAAQQADEMNALHKRLRGGH